MSGGLDPTRDFWFKTGFRRFYVERILTRKGSYCFRADSWGRSPILKGTLNPTPPIYRLMGDGEAQREGVVSHIEIVHLHHAPSPYE